ncbi:MULTISPECIES: tRNA1(Val) (adenine(37)-N6)-methyltransferase [unclassified Vibrio]|uniref:tRNA1(Val) (adenine(37)-N6)-methyltransferase n=2 Tax=Vibrio TaxID=662 RepID=UPI0014836EF8|nr:MULTISPECIES: tRNA1(Val) (adenine(37)-N6)-methyltransferase [unclassified Vibrio]NNN45947.1 tRNA1(Val) (adenine(37)-N6)-methyltransferase [Vibrio sp. 1-1(7)]NNN73776.1 tRNA1(Val) (adenine(37)-N6)-methyltransferase [Vibrio sp. 12-2(3-a)]
MKSNPFKFKQFSITQQQCGMPVSTDGVMLGAWAFTHSPKRILDIGSGTGLLSLMCAQRFAQVSICAIDIDPLAFNSTTHNVALSPWQERIEVYQQDILTTLFSTHFDGVICNPPYFTSGEMAHSYSRALARHTQNLTHSSLIDRLADLLTEDGRACFILPIKEGKSFIQLAQQQGWYLTRLCEVSPTPSKAVHRLLFELSKKMSQVERSKLTIHTKNGYSDDFIALTRDFYLKMK